MEDMENNNVTEIESMSENEIIKASTDAVDEVPDFEAEMAKLFASDLESIEEESAVSKDLEGFAKGFPDWDLHPMKV